MKTCGTCKHWKLPGHRWRKCHAGKDGLKMNYADVCYWAPSKWEPLLVRKEVKADV